MASDTRTEDARGQGGLRSVRTAAVVIYATFGLLIVTIPQSLPNWLRDMEENPAQQILLQAASGVQVAAQMVGLDVPYRRVRSAFHAWTGKDDD
jgi:hypothetical protein